MSPDKTKNKNNLFQNEIRHNYLKIGKKRTYEEAFASEIKGNKNSYISIIDECSPKKSIRLDANVNFNLKEFTQSISKDYFFLTNNKEIQFSLEEMEVEHFLGHEQPSTSKDYKFKNEANCYATILETSKIVFKAEEDENSQGFVTLENSEKEESFDFGNKI